MGHLLRHWKSCDHLKIGAHPWGCHPQGAFLRQNGLWAEMGKPSRLVFTSSQCLELHVEGCFSVKVPWTSIHPQDGVGLQKSNKALPTHVYITMHHAFLPLFGRFWREFLIFFFKFITRQPAGIDLAKKNAKNSKFLSKLGPNLSIFSPNLSIFSPNFHFFRQKWANSDQKWANLDQKWANLDQKWAKLDKNGQIWTMSTCWAFDIVQIWPFLSKFAHFGAPNFPHFAQFLPTVCPIQIWRQNFDFSSLKERNRRIENQASKFRAKSTLSKANRSAWHSLTQDKTRQAPAPENAGFFSCAFFFFFFFF